VYAEPPIDLKLVLDYRRADAVTPEFLSQEDAELGGSAYTR